MAHSLPVIVGFGGYNAAGRSSSHQAFRRMVLESLTAEQQQQTIVSLACLMGLVKSVEGGYEDRQQQQRAATVVSEKYRQAVIDGTLVRQIEQFDAANLSGNRKVDFSPQKTLVFSLAKRDLPKNLPQHWHVRV